MTLESTIDPTVHHRRWVILGVLCLSLVLVVLGNTTLNVALPTLVRDLDATNSELQWIVDAYGLVFGGLLLTAGAIGDRFGRKGALQIGLVIFGLASVMGTVADQPAHLIAARAVMGVGAAFVMPATLSILTNVFPANERGKAIGIWAAFAGVGGATGPVVGGWLLEHFWWGSLFLMNVLVVVGALAVGAVLLPTSRDPHQTRLDPTGAVLSIVALGGLLYGIIEGPVRGWTDPGTLVAFGVALVVGVVFVWWELRVENPMLPMRLFRERSFSVGSSSVTLAFFAMFGLMFLLTQYLQFVLGYTPLEAGVRTLPTAAGLMIAAPNSDRLARSFGANRVVGGGLVVVALGLVALSFFGTSTPYWELGLLLFFLGLGMGASQAPATGSIMAAMPLSKAGVGSAVNDTSREVGGAIGVAVLGSALSAAYTSNFDATVPAGAPPEAVDVARESVGSALGVAARVGDAAAPLADAARHSFTDAMGVSFLIAAAVVAFGAAVAWRKLPPVNHPPELGPTGDLGNSGPS